MANRFPLIFNSGAGQIQELAASDNLDLTSSNLVNAGILFTSSGSATAPSLQIGSGTTYNPGLYSPGTDQVAVATNGSGRLFINATGEILAGTSISVDGNWKIQADAAAGALTGIGVNNNGGYGVYLIYDNSVRYSGAGVLRNIANSPLAFETNNTERLRITSAGLVGIGTSAPSSLLHVSNGNILLSNAYYLASRNAADNANLSLIGRDTSNNVLIDPDQYGTKIGGTTLVTTSTGRVGIGTTGPSKLLTIGSSTTANTTVRLNNSLTAGSDTGMYSFGLDDTEDFAGMKLDYSDRVAKGLQIFTASAYGYPISFSTNGSQNMTIDSSGRLLVGTTTANTKFVFGGTTLTDAEVSVYTTNSSGGNSTSFSFWRNYTIGSSIPFRACHISNINTDDSFSSTNDQALGFFTKSGTAEPTERMRIRSDGASLYHSAANNGISLGITGSSGTSNRLFSGGHSASSIGVYTETFLVWSNGDVQNTNNSYGAISDAKLKENIVDANSQWDDLKALQVRNYNFKEGQTHTQIGLVAQEVELVSPGLVNESPDRDAEGNDLGTVTKSVNYSVLYMKAVKALQEAMERIEQLEARLTAAGIE